MRQGEATADRRAPRHKAELDRGHDWELRVDLDRKLHVAFYNIVETNLHCKTRRCASASVPAVKDDI